MWARLAFAMLVVAAVVPRAGAQTEEARKLQKQFQDACVAGDMSAIAPLMADDAIFIHGNDYVGELGERATHLVGHDQEARVRSHMERILA